MRETRIKLFFNSLLISLTIFAYIPYVSAQEFCYSSGGVFGIIVLSVFTTVFVIALTVAVLWLLWTKNLLNLDFILKTISKSKGKSEERRPDLEAPKQDYAFDNPYFEEDEKESNTQKDTIILVEGQTDDKQQNVLQINNKNNSQRMCDEKQRNGHLINNRFVKSLPLSAVFSNGPFKKSKLENVKSMDDYFVYEKPERLEIELIGRDFTGLGFNICGNMKDGIFVKNVLNRGPANDSGKIKSGDRITGVNVSFEGMVFDDAVSILSYASPYNVRIQVEKCGQYSVVEKMTNTLNTNKNLVSNTNKSLVHPLYRSHSVDDLSRITKDVSLSEKSTTSSKNVIQKIKTEILNRIHVRSTNAAENVIERERPRSRESMPSSIEVAQPLPQTQVEPQTCKTPEPKPIEDEVDRSLTETQLSSETPKVDENQVKKVVPAKRKGKAPQPPIEAHNMSTESQSISLSIPLTPTNGEMIETKADVHNEETPVIQSDQNVEQEFKVNDEVNDESLDSREDEKSHRTTSTESMNSEKHNISEDLNSVPNRSHSPQRVQSPTGKMKSSSMSDLTSNKSDKLHTVLLERAVSLDMNGQNLPEENLSNIHGKNLLVLNDDNTDSMPIITWSLTKQMKNEMDSSESTLNEINRSLVNSIELSEKINSSEVKINDFCDDSMKIDTNYSEPQNFVSHIKVEVPPITSTPLKTNEISANQTIEQYIQLDSSFTSSETESGEQTLKEVNESDSRSGCESSQRQESDQTNDNRNKEVIELSESELDGVMMSHKQFLLKQATNGSSQGSQSKVGSVINSGLMSHLREPQYESLDFESWHYMSEDENSNISKTQTEPTLYKTALDITLSEESEEPVKTRRLPEVSGITLKTGENGEITNTVFISTTDLGDSSFSSCSSSPPSK